MDFIAHGSAASSVLKSETGWELSEFLPFWVLDDLVKRTNLLCAIVSIDHLGF